jgi:hypothetical protein
MIIHYENWQNGKELADYLKKEVRDTGYTYILGVSNVLKIINETEYIYNNKIITLDSIICFEDVSFDDDILDVKTYCFDGFLIKVVII